MDECYTSNVPFGALVCGWKIKLYFGRNIQYQYVISLVWPTRNSLKLYFTPPKPYILFCPHLSSPLIRSSLHPPPTPQLPHPTTSSLYLSFKIKGEKRYFNLQGNNKKRMFVYYECSFKFFIFFYFSSTTSAPRSDCCILTNKHTDGQTKLTVEVAKDELFFVVRAYPILVSCIGMCTTHTTGM